MVKSASTTESTIARRLNAIQRANRSLLLFMLFASTILSFSSEVLGMSKAVAFCLDATLLLVVLQLFLKETDYSPSKVLKRYREMSVSTAAGVTVLDFLISTGIATFASVFLPRLYSVLTLDQSTASSAWELIFVFFSFAVLAPFYEELVFRGLALSAYNNARSALFAVLFTSILFGFVHGSIVQTLVIFPGAILFALVMLKTGQLWTVIMAHGFYNFVVTLLIEFDVPEPPATPTFGILGLVVAIAAFCIAVRWLGLPKSSTERDEDIKKQKIWTTSLVIVVVIAVLFNLLTTYVALGPGVESLQ